MAVETADKLHPRDVTFDKAEQTPSMEVGTADKRRVCLPGLPGCDYGDGLVQDLHLLPV